MSVKDVCAIHFECDSCGLKSVLSKSEHEYTYPANWFKVILRGKTEVGRKEFDLCGTCTGNLVTVIEEGEIDYHPEGTNIS